MIRIVITAAISAILVPMGQLAKPANMTSMEPIQQGLKGGAICAPMAVISAILPTSASYAKMAMS